jgi:hypothetical protein
MRKFGILVVITLLAAGPAGAALIRVEPDRFPVGVDIRSAFPGVTLSVPNQPSTAIVPEVGTSVFLGGANIATTGEKVFARSPAGDCQISGPAIVDTGKTWSSVCGLLRADFSAKTRFVSIDVIFDDDDIGVLSAFDTAGTLLSQITGAGDGRGPVPFQTLTISRPAADIAYILTGGFAREGSYLDNLRFSVAEPGTVALLGVAFTALGFARRRSQH